MFYEKRFRFFRNVHRTPWVLCNFILKKIIKVSKYQNIAASVLRLLRSTTDWSGRQEICSNEKSRSRSRARNRYHLHTQARTGRSPCEGLVGE